MVSFYIHDIWGILLHGVHGEDAQVHTAHTCGARIPEQPQATEPVPSTPAILQHTDGVQRPDLRPYDAHFPHSSPQGIRPCAEQIQAGC